jgi:hypothetical protein
MTRSLLSPKVAAYPGLVLIQLCQRCSLRRISFTIDSHADQYPFQVAISCLDSFANATKDVVLSIVHGISPTQAGGCRRWWLWEDLSLVVSAYRKHIALPFPIVVSKLELTHLHDSVFSKGIFPEV